MVSTLNKLTLQKTFANFFDNKVKTQQENRKSYIKTLAGARK